MDTRTAVIGQLDPEKQAHIDALSLEDMLRFWRFAPVGALDKSPMSIHFTNRLFNLRQTDNDAWVRASKKVGWDQ